MTKCLKILLHFLLSAPLLFAQNEEGQFGQTDVEEQSKYTAETITVSDGLHSNNIYDVLQDSLGFLWLASSSGLQKYDGYTFTLYTPDSSDATSHAVHELYEDKDRNLWLQMETGLSRYQRETDDFVRYYFVNGKNDTIPYSVRSIAEDLEGTLWVWIQDSGLYQLDLETKNFSPQDKVNDVKKQVVLKETNRKGIFETRITFQSGHYGRTLRYKFAIKRKNGTMEWEQNPNLAHSESGDRELFLTGDTLILSPVEFNSRMNIVQEKTETLPESDLRPTYVKFTVDLNNLENTLSKGDEIQLRGDISPLRWQDEFRVNCIAFDSENRLWVGTDNMGLFRFNLETGEYHNFVANPESSGSISANQITAAIRDQDGDLWFGSYRGLNRFKPDKETFENYFVDSSDLTNPVNGVHRLRDDRKGNIWTQSQRNNGGISYFNKKNKKFTHYSTGFGLWFKSFILDRSGILWLGNEFRGLHKLNLKARKFSAFSIRKDGKDVLQGKPVFSVHEDRAGEVWIGGQLDGLYRYNRGTGKSTFYRVNSANRFANVINYILQDRRGTYWIGTVLGLNRFDETTGHFKQIEIAPYTKQFELTSYIYEDAYGVLWILTRRGYLVQFNPNTHEAEFFSVFGNPNLDRQINFCDLIEDPGGFFWIAAGDNGGLYKFDLDEKKFTIIEKIGIVNIASIYLDDDGILWCGTTMQGLIRYDTKTDTKSIISEKDGLLCSNIVGLEADQSGNLWIGSQKGLSRYNPQTGVCKNYFKEDGFFTDEFSYQAHAKGKNGELIFGAMHGVVTFHPDSIKDSDYIPPIVLTDFRINNKTVGIGNNSPLKKNISISKEITLAHDQNDIAITFAALDFSHPERNQYSFFLENFEDNWRQPGIERTAYYTNLDPGEYIFRVRGTNSDGVWNEEVTSIKIHVLSPWWKTNWAYTLYVILIGLTLYGLRRFELKRAHLKSELEKSKEVDEMKSRFFANISHEFRTPLTLILGPLQKFLSTAEDKESHKDVLTMQRNARRLQQLIDQLLDLSKIEADRMPLQAQPDDIVQRIREWTASFVSLAESRNIALDLNFPEQPIIAYFDPEKLEKIVYNLLGNAFKFTPEGGRITVAADISPSSGAVKGSMAQVIQITISDSGVGIAPEHLDHIFDRFYSTNESTTGEQSSTGIGLALTKEFIELHHGKIEVTSEVGKGTKFTIMLPLGKDHLKPEEIVDIPLNPPSKGDFTVPPFEGGRGGMFEAEVKHAPPQNAPTLLIVEDNPDMRRFLRNCLARDFDIVEAQNGKSGYETAQEKMPDIIVSDVMMPEMDGFEFCQKIKTDELTSHIPVILLTARASKESKVEGLETGADDYVVKPFDAEELIVRSKNLIEQRQKLRERFSREITVKPKDITVTSIDEQLLQRAINIVEENISNIDFNIDQFCSEIGMSRPTLNRKLRALTGFSTNEFIRTLRLKRASQLLGKRSATIVEIAYEVGFNNPSYFAECFRKQFGKSPSEYASN